MTHGAARASSARASCRPLVFISLPLARRLRALLELTLRLSLGASALLLAAALCLLALRLRARRRAPRRAPWRRRGAARVRGGRAAESDRDQLVSSTELGRSSLADGDAPDADASPRPPKRPKGGKRAYKSVGEMIEV